MRTSSQKAPSTRRCIKTPYGGHLTDFQPCGQKEPTAPEGALRPDVRLDVQSDRPPERAPHQKVHYDIYISACAGTPHADLLPCPPASRYPVLQSLFTFPPLKGRNDASSPAITTTIVNDTAIPTPPAPSSPSFRSRETGPVPRGGHSPAPARSRIYVVRVGHRHPVRAH